MRIFQILLILVCIKGVLSMPAFGMSVSEAYRAIPHRQTTFNPKIAKMQEKEKAYLAKSFSLLDQAMAARVSALQWLHSDDRHGESLTQYQVNINKVLAQLGHLETPPRLKSYHQLVTDAVKEQRRYFAHLQKGGTFDPRHALVQQSHQKLVEAYQILMRLYPTEAVHNRNAFFDHLCALDFI